VLGSNVSLNVAAGYAALGVGNRAGQNAPPTTFTNPEDAALSLLRFYNPTSKSANLEFGGLICGINAVIRNTFVVGTTNSVDAWAIPCPVDSVGHVGVPLANYHTHGLQPGEGPSGGIRDPDNPQAPCTTITGDGDLAVANDRWAAGFTSVRFYMMTPYDSIYRYQGPISQRNVQRLAGTQWVTFNPCTGQ
jgi:hypothetical protein